MKSMNLWLSTGMGLAISFGLAGCAGTLTADEQDELLRGHTTSGAGGSTSTSTTATSGAGGTGGALPPVDNCVMTSMKGCALAVCHNAGATKVAGLDLTYAALTTKYKALYYDKPNLGIGDTDPMYCQPGAGKLVDSANPTASLIYTKTLTQAERDAMKMPPCGTAMPNTGAPPMDADKACILSWINGVIAGSKATP